jgi:hypothetical protein
MRSALSAQTSSDRIIPQHVASNKTRARSRQFPDVKLNEMAKAWQLSTPGRTVIDRSMGQALRYQHIADRSAAAKSRPQLLALVVIARSRRQNEWACVQQSQQSNLRRLPPAFLLDATRRTECRGIDIGKTHFHAANPECAAVENAVEMGTLAAKSETLRDRCRDRRDRRHRCYRGQWRRRRTRGRECGYRNRDRRRRYRQCTGLPERYWFRWRGSRNGRLSHRQGGAGHLYGSHRFRLDIGPVIVPDNKSHGRHCKPRQHTEAASTL